MSAEPEMDIKLLGPPEIEVDGAPVDFDTRKAVAVLAYLVVEQKASRETLTGLFWSESPPDRARATLRRTLSSIRKGMGPHAIDADRYEVRLGDVGSDIHRFHAAMDATRTHGHKGSDFCSSCIGALGEAASLYRGTFLMGFMIGSAPEFEDWERTTSEEFRRAAGQVFNRLAQAHAARGAYAEAIAAVSRWIELDLLHEPARRMLMLLSAWAGDRPGAIAAYRDFVAVLDRELAVPPLEETTELYEAILDNDLPRAPTIVIPANLHDRAPAPAEKLIDRANEMARLSTLLSKSQASGLVVCLQGAPWMGKTRLLEELAASATSHTVLAARAFRAEQLLPYGVTAQLFATVTRDSLPDDLPDWALNEVGRVIPAIAGAGTGQGSDRFGELRLLEGIFQVLTRLALERPLLVTIDDIKWIDQASATVLSYLAKRLEGHPILVVTSRRSDEIVDPQIRDVLSNAQTIELRPLQPKDLPERVTNAEAAIRATGGIPLLVAEHIAGRSDSGEVGRYLRMRMEGISGLAGQVLSTAAVLSGSCSFGVLRAVSGRSDEEIVDSVDELVTAGLLREVPGTETLTLALYALEQMTLGSLSLARRRLLHRRVAEVLADVPRARSDLRLTAQVASQFMDAGDPRAAEWFRLAGDLARSSYANQEALSFYETAVALGDEAVGELHLAIAELSMAAGGYRDAIASLTTAAARSEGETLGCVEHRLGEVHRLLGRFDLAAEHFQRAMSSHPRPEEVYADWALLAHRIGDDSRAQELGKMALDAAETTEPSVSSRIHNVNGVIANSPNDAIAHLDRALELANGDDVAVMAALNNKAHVLAESGDPGMAIDLVQQAIEIAVRTGHRHREATLRDFLADLYHRTGDEQLSRRTQTDAMRLFAVLGATESLEPELWLLSRW